MTWKGLTLSQPYASAIAIGPKRVEDRSTPIGRKVAPCWVGLHAGMSEYRMSDEAWERFAAAWPDCRQLSDVPSGAMLAAILIDWVAAYPATDITREQFAMLGAREQSLLGDDWAFGPWCLHIAEVRLLPEPMPCRGMLGLWPVNDPEIVAALELVRGA